MTALYRLLRGCQVFPDKDIAVMFDVLRVGFHDLLLCQNDSEIDVCGLFMQLVCQTLLSFTDVSKYICSGNQKQAPNQKISQNHQLNRCAKQHERHNNQ